MRGYDDLPPEVLAQLTVLPETPPGDFVCAICGDLASNKFIYSPRDVHRPPVCKFCENAKGFAWNGNIISRSRNLKGGSFRDRRHALQIDALADALATEAQTQKQGRQHGRA